MTAPAPAPMAPLHPGERIRARGYDRRLVFWASLFAGTVFLAIGMLVGLTAKSWHDRAMDQARADVRNTSVVVTETVARTVQLVDATLELTGRRIIEHFGDEDEIFAYLREELAFAPHLRQLVVVTPDGTIRHDTAKTGQARLDVTEILASRAAGGSELFIGAVHAGRFLGRSDDSGQRLIPMARVVMNGYGEPMVVLVAAVNQNHFNAAFGEVAAGRDSLVALARYDGTLLAASGGSHDWSPGALAKTPPFADHLHRAEFGEYSGDQPDGIERLSAYRMTHRWPLVVTAGLSRAEIDSRWREESMSMALPAGLVCAILLAIAVVLVRVLLVRAREEEALAIAGRALMGVGEGIIITDPAEGNRILYVNPAFERMSGYGLAEVIGHNPRFLHGADRDQPGLLAIREAVAAQGGTSVDLRNYRKGGESYWVNLTITPVRDEAGMLTHYVGVQRDITARMLADAQRERLIAELTDAGAKLHRFTYVASHELLQPIVSIQGFASLLERHAAGLDELGREALTEVVEGAARARAMVAGLREYFQLSAADAPLTDVDMGAIVRSVVEMLADMPAAAGADIKIDDLPVVRADDQQMRLLWRNLVENAVKFRAPGSPPCVAISATRVEGAWRFAIADQGIGVAPERQAIIFDVLSRLHGADYPGLGMGLPACRTIVERHGGRIWVESRPGGGSTFFFTIPDPEGRLP